MQDFGASQIYPYEQMRIGDTMSFTRNFPLAICFLLVSSVPFGEIHAAPAYFAGTGHYYEFVPFTDTVAGAQYWNHVRNLSLQSTHLGQHGYLATITSSEENDFITGLVGLGRSAWFGGTDEPHEGTWIWADGPEAGEVFWTGGLGGSTSTYANWEFNHPNDAFNADFTIYRIQSFSNNNIGEWATFGNFHSFRPDGYVVEYSAVPEPSSALLLSCACFGFVSFRRKRN